MDPQPSAVAGVLTEQDRLAPWRLADRGARRIAVSVVAGSLAATVAGATLPSWVDEEVLRVTLVDVSSGFQHTWFWDLPVGAAWWALALVLLLPCLAVLVGARRTRQRLDHATASLPDDPPPTRRGPPTATPAQVLALSFPPRLSVWATAGRLAAFPAGLVVVSVVLAALGESDSGAGAWIAATGWMWVIIAALVWSVTTGLMFARIRVFRRTFG